MKQRIKDDPSFSADTHLRRSAAETLGELFHTKSAGKKNTFSLESETISLWKHESFYININIEVVLELSGWKLAYIRLQCGLGNSETY